MACMHSWQDQHGSASVLFRAVRRVGIQVGIPSQLHRSPCVAAPLAKKYPGQKNPLPAMQANSLSWIRSASFSCHAIFVQFCLCSRNPGCPNNQPYRQPQTFDIFCKISVWRSKIFCSSFMYKFQSLPNKFPMIF